MANKQVWTATGRRKSSDAQVKLVGGTGKITINGKDVHEYMPYETLVTDLMQPLVATNNENRFDIEEILLPIYLFVLLLLFLSFAVFL